MRRAARTAGRRPHARRSGSIPTSGCDSIGETGYVRHRRRLADLSAARFSCRVGESVSAGRVYDRLHAKSVCRYRGSSACYRRSAAQMDARPRSGRALERLGARVGATGSPHGSTLHSHAAELRSTPSKSVAIPPAVNTVYLSFVSFLHPPSRRFRRSDIQHQYRQNRQ